MFSPNPAVVSEAKPRTRSHQNQWKSTLTKCLINSVIIFQWDIDITATQHLPLSEKVIIIIVNRLSRSRSLRRSLFWKCFIPVLTLLTIALYLFIFLKDRTTLEQLFVHNEKISEYGSKNVVGWGGQWTVSDKRWTDLEEAWLESCFTHTGWIDFMREVVSFGVKNLA